MAPSIPRATYRLQLTPNFGFAAAAAIVPYLRALGVSHLYASPFLKARSGSTHGYDVIDYGSLNPELGGETAFAELCDALAHANIGLILDFVPNHMAIHHADNAWWLDVLEWGRNSPHAAAFDIDWRYFPGHQRVLVPILGAPYGDALAAGDIELRFAQESGTFSAWYYEHRLPIDPRCYAEILRTVVAAEKCDASPLGRRLLELAEHYGRALTRGAASKLKAELAALGDGADAIQRGLRTYRPTAADATTSTLHELLERQHYRLAHWRLAGSELNYRRFFDITTLAGLRMEHRATFTAVHALAARLIEDGQVHGLRIDHIDGLCDPQQYCRSLQRLIRAGRPMRDGGIYVVVEKILAEGERLPPLAGVAGTTGYEWLNLISRVLVDRSGLRQLTRTWHDITGDRRSFDDVLLAAKRDVMTKVLGSERAALLRLLSDIAAGHPATRDYAGGRLRAAFELFILHFPVYRTYVTAAGTSAGDRETITTALAKARAEWIGADVGIFDFLRDALTLDLIERADARLRSDIGRFAAKVQQFTGPMMAKALEDTSFYRYHRMLALNEVGGNPAADGLSIADFHDRMEQRAAAPSQGLTATATHDTKRGEDARTRLLALSELADDWANSVQDWRTLNAGIVEGRPERTRIPSHAHEYMLYQALLGAWPLAGIDHDFVARMIGYAVKAAREGKEETSWLAPNETYEMGLRTFLTELLDHRRSQRFIDSFDAFARRAALLGALNSLVQVTLKATIPGVPDFYQGSELWDLSLVDPDNRRPVDLSARASLLESFGGTIDWSALAATWPDGRIKLALTHRLLEICRAFAELFATGSYRPLEVTGQHRGDIIAFARIKEPDAIIVACGRRSAPRTEHGRRWPSGLDWEASIPLRDFSDVEDLLSDGAKISRLELNIGGMFEPLPIACLRARCASHTAK